MQQLLRLINVYGHDIERYMSDLGLGPLEAIAGSIFIVIVTYFFTHLPGIRKLLHPQSRLEGCWYQIVGIEERPHSISKIKHNFFGRTWSYEGYGYSANFELVTRWIGEHIKFNNERWIFEEDVTHLSPNGDKIGQSYAITVLNIRTRAPALNEGEHLYGRAIDIDFGEGEEAVGFKLELIKVRRADRPESLNLSQQNAAKLFTDIRKTVGK